MPVLAVWCLPCNDMSRIYVCIIINRMAYRIAPESEKQSHQSSTACHPIASLHSLLPPIWFPSETKSSFFSSCLCSIISLVPENVPRRHSMRCFQTRCCLCCFQVGKLCHVLSCQKGVRELSTD